MGSYGADALDVLGASLAPVGRGGAAQEAVVEVAQLDRGLLVVRHGARGVGAADLRGVRASRAAGPEVDHPPDVGRRDELAG